MVSGRSSSTSTRAGRQAARHGVAFAAALTIASATPRPALAQVNVEVLRPNLFRAGWSGGLDASFAVSRGNVELLDVGGAGRVQYQTLYPVAPPEEGAEPAVPFFRQRVFLTTNGRFAERAGAAFINQEYTHLRWTGMWHPRVGSDVFVQQQLNEFQRLRVRALAGAGARVEIVHHPVFLAWAGSAYMIEFERIAVQPGAPDDPETLAHRVTNYLTLRLAAYGGKLLAQNTVYYQPRIGDVGDFRLLEELEVVARVDEVLGLGASLSVLHDSRPPTGVRTTDLRLVNTVKIAF